MESQAVVSLSGSILGSPWGVEVRQIFYSTPYRVAAGLQH